MKARNCGNFASGGSLKGAPLTRHMIPPTPEHPANRSILLFLAAHAPPGLWEPFSLAVKEERAFAYNKEPYLVWDFLQSALPVDCRCLLYGRCALVAPGGAILAVVIGDSYVLRVPIDVAMARLQSPKMQWYVGIKEIAGSMAPHNLFGKEWVWGMAHNEEPSWCRSVFDLVESPQAGPGSM